MGNRSVRILFVVPKGDKPSSMIFAERQIEAIRSYGFVGEVFYLESRTSCGILMREMFRFRQVVKDFLPEIIHAQYGTVTAFFCACLSPVPLIVTYRGSDLNPVGYASPRALIGRLMSQIAAFRAQGIICVSEELKSRLKFGQSRACVIPSGVDTRMFFPVPRDEARLKLDWSLNEKIVIFNAGSDAKLKGLELAQAAISRAEELLKHKIRFVILNGEHDPSQMPWLLNGADCVLVTSKFEGSPNIVKEALACNVPIVSVAVGDVSQRLLQVSGCVLCARNCSELAKGLVDVLGRKSRIDGSLAVKSIALEATASQVIDVYQQCVR